MRALRVVAAAAALALPAVALAAEPRLAALPSPTAALSAEPPLRGGATAAAEGVRHPVDSTTDVEVSVDAAGEPFAVSATQRLTVRRVGDYYFTIAAPVVDVAAAPGSAGAPGLRAGAFLWQGFNPGRRELAARAELEVAATVPALPLRVAVTRERVTLENATAVTAGAFTADALAPQLRAYLAELARAEREGRPAAGGFALLTTPAAPRRVTVRAPLLVTGTVGGRRVRVVVSAAPRTFPRGRVELTVRPLHVAPEAPAPAGGQRLLAIAVRASLAAARTRQYDAFLGNPDPGGRNTTVYHYRSKTRPAPVAAGRPPEETGGGAAGIALWALGGAAALAAALTLWARA